nr:trafficking protein particle complex subunit 2-like protein [Quercus suber]
MPAKTVGHDFGLLHALDERIALYGWLTNTSVKFVIVVDMEGRTAPTLEAGRTVGLGLRGGDLVGAFQALQTAYIRLLRNPFYVPNDHDPKLSKNTGASLLITNSKFINDVERIGKNWYPGATDL